MCILHCIAMCLVRLKELCYNGRAVGGHGERGRDL